MTEQETTKGGQVLTDLSNAMVALHREHFGRGPGAAKSVVSDGMVVCVLTDVYTPVEKTLIGAGRFDHVRETRSLHNQARESEYKSRVEEITGREVSALMSSVHAGPDVAVEIFLLA